MITGSVFGSAYVNNNILQILLFGVIYYQLSKQDKRGTLYLTGTYAVLEVIGIVVVMLIK